MDYKKLIKKLEEERQFRAMELRAIANTNENKEYKVTGYACMFDKPFVLGSFRDWDGVIYEFREQVARDAFAGCDMSDVIFNLNHEGRVYARLSNNTLKLTTDDTGLNVEAYLGGTEEGRKIHEEIEGGYLTKMSYQFKVEEDKREEFTEGEKRVILRTITKFKKLYDVSVVSIPADDHTSISARGFCDGVIAEIEAERLKVQEEEKRQKEIQSENEARERELALLEAL